MGIRINSHERIKIDSHESIKINEWDNKQIVDNTTRAIKTTQNQRTHLFPIKTILEKDKESQPNTDNDLDDVGTLRLDSGEGLFDYSPLKLASFKSYAANAINQQRTVLGTPNSGPISSNP